MSNIPKALQQYHQVDTHSGVAYASPHRLIQMLMDGALERIAVAKGCIQRQDIVAKGQQIGDAVDIIGGLREGLNGETGSEIVVNLDALYDYMQRRLLEANLHGDIVILDEVADLLRSIKEAWDAIGETSETDASPASTVDRPA
ncbi:MAG: flagellar export chaperone FliS [Candidatus Competibacteraceae bacterium]|nr:flagellar export chaperone FliS [Candidatus Competibacteraceae bacterium]